MLKYTRIGVNTLTCIVVISIILIIVFIKNIIPNKQEISNNNENIYKYSNYAVYNAYNKYDAYATYYNYYMDYYNKLIDINIDIPKIIIPKIGLSINVSDKIINESEYAIQKNERWLEIGYPGLGLLNKGDTILYLENNQTYIYAISSIKVLTKVDYFENIESKEIVITTKNYDNTITCIHAIR